MTIITVILLAAIINLREILSISAVTDQNFIFQSNFLGLSLTKDQFFLGLKDVQDKKVSMTNIFQTKILGNRTSTTKVVLEAQWGICSAPCVLRQYTVVFA